MVEGKKQIKTVVLTEETKGKLDEYRSKLSKDLGFTVSYSDTISYVLKRLGELSPA